ncbi:MAG: M1 family metallopeptidase [Fluviicola sp.]|nr:M1 family metallopeptidase [Fluviicola sp.]
MKLTFVTLLLFCSISYSQKEIDVLQYNLNIAIEDTTDVIDVVEEITVLFVEDCQSFSLNLVDLDSLTGSGMVVKSVTSNNVALKFEHQYFALKIFTDSRKKGEEGIFQIHYQGAPADGLIIGENKYGERTFFGDNWPNRAQHWIACNDHPSDKAKVKFTIRAPDHYSIIANGELIDIFDADAPYYSITEYATETELPTKVMVFGAADFEIQKMESLTDFELSSWVYKKNAGDALADLNVAPDPLHFFIKKIGPYPFEKLANVQSTTRFGGMENASCIFYDEEAFTGKNEMENLIAHEIAHQWFGNSVTELDWQHLWLSEGFATYLTNLHIEQKYGRDAMNLQLEKDRQRIIRFEDKVKRPVIDTITVNWMQLLNPNSYQKGSWVLHMLRNKVGDSLFWQGLQTYYQKYKYKNASSDDFFADMEEVSQQNLQVFFNQWLRSSEMPNIKVREKKKCFKRILIIEQIQNEAFEFSIEVELSEDDNKRTQTLHFTKETKTIEIELGKKTAFDYQLDPNHNLLYRESIDVVLIKK